MICHENLLKDRDEGWGEANGEQLLVYWLLVWRSPFTIHHSPFTISSPLAIDHWRLTIDHFLSSSKFL
ncbi:MAG: hypothetical protein V9G20_27760 [Candidatus Promineifilaceae bacterium]